MYVFFKIKEDVVEMSSSRYELVNINNVKELADYLLDVLFESRDFLFNLTGDYESYDDLHKSIDRTLNAIKDLKDLAGVKWEADFYCMTIYFVNDFPEVIKDFNNFITDYSKEYLCEEFFKIMSKPVDEDEEDDYVYYREISPQMSESDFLEYLNEVIERLEDDQQR